MRERLDELLSRLAESEPTQAEVDELVTLLEAHPAARAEAVELLMLDSQLVELFRGRRERAPRIDAADAGMVIGLGPQSRDRPAGRTSPRRRPLPWMIATAASFILFLLVTGLALRSRPGAMPPRTQPAEDDRRNMMDDGALAVLTRVVEARWDAAGPPAEEGAILRAGRLRLASGWVQIEFFSGASVILEGPADLELISPLRACCRRGKLRTHVPATALGFAIDAPGLKTVDLGTEFALSVDEAGAGEVHVLDGEVELHGSGDRPAIRDVRRLKAGRGARFGSGEGLSEIAAVPAGFVGRDKLLQLEDERSRVSHRRWQSSVEALKADPSVVLYYSFDDHSPWERTLQDVGPGRPGPMDGAIVGCHWAGGRWPGKGALEFKRVSDRVRIDVPGQFDSLTLEAWVRIEGFDQWLSSLMLTDDWEPGEVHWQLSDLGELILGVSDGGGVNYFSPAVLGPRDLGRWVHLATVYDSERKLVLHYLDGKPVSRHDIKAAVPLRIGAAEIGNWTTHTTRSHPFRSLNGRMDEFGIYGRALSGDEIRAMYELGKPSS